VPGATGSISEFITKSITTDNSHLTPGTAQNQALTALETNFPDLTVETGQVQILQIYSLNTIYFSTNGTAWRDRTGWTGPTTVCGNGPDQPAWFGITCDANEVVTNMAFASNDLLGPIPSEIGALTGLGMCPIELI
jgi:hypothetical protein